MYRDAYCFWLLTDAPSVNYAIDFFLVNLYFLKYRLTQTEIDTAKEQLATSFILLQDLNTEQKNDNILDSIERYGIYSTPEEMVKLYQNTPVTPEQLQSFIEQLSKTLNLVCVGTPLANNPIMTEEDYQKKIEDYKKMSYQEMERTYYDCLAKILIDKNFEPLKEDENLEKGIQRVATEQREKNKNKGTKTSDVIITKLVKLTEEFHLLKPKPPVQENKKNALPKEPFQPKQFQNQNQSRRYTLSDLQVPTTFEKRVRSHSM
jgi:hypothetical protein